MLGHQQLEAFEHDGFLLLESPLTPEQLDRAEDAFDRLIVVRQVRSRASTTRPAERKRSKVLAFRNQDPALDLSAALAVDEPFVELISHPWFEEVAKQLLRSDRVRLVELGPSQFRPGAGAAARRSAAEDREWWRKGAHIDLQVTTTDFNATPRRDILALWFWVGDVTADMGAMRILPGSHRRINEHWEMILSPHHKTQLPRVHGVRPHPAETHNTYPEYLPEPHDFQYTECEPMPVAVKRGTAQFFTQSMLHSASVNTYRFKQSLPLSAFSSSVSLYAVSDSIARPHATQRFCNMPSHVVCVTASLAWVWCCSTNVLRLQLVQLRHGTSERYANFLVCS